MKITLKKNPASPTIIEGFPGFGLVGTITTEYLIDALKAKYIGSIKIDGLAPMVAIHEGEMIRPMGIYYDDKTNIIILHVMTNVTGMEFEVADGLIELAAKLKAKEIISVEGVGSPISTEEPRLFHYANNTGSEKKLRSVKIDKLSEGIVMGVTASLLLNANHSTNITCFFAETHSKLPDSFAAAKVVEGLDKYLGLKIDYKPLLKQAEKFEEKIKDLIQKGQTAKKAQMDKQLSYVG